MHVVALEEDLMSIIDGNSMSWPLLHVVSCLMYLNAAASMQLAVPLQLPQCSCPIAAASMSHCSCLNVPLQLPQCLIAGGSNPVFDEVVVSLSLMNRVITFDETAGTLPGNF